MSAVSSARHDCSAPPKRLGQVSECWVLDSNGTKKPVLATRTSWSVASGGSRSVTTFSALARPTGQHSWPERRPDLRRSPLERICCPVVIAMNCLHGPQRIQATRVHGPRPAARGKIRITMGVRFPGESIEYRHARDRLLRDEIELRRATEQVAAAHRAMPPGGRVPEDYVFRGLNSSGDATDVRLSDLFGRKIESVAIYCYMFPRHSGDTRPAPTSGPLSGWPPRRDTLSLVHGVSRPTRRRRRAREPENGPRGCGRRTTGPVAQCRGRPGVATSTAPLGRWQQLPAWSPPTSGQAGSPPGADNVSHDHNNTSGISAVVGSRLAH